MKKYIIYSYLTICILIAIGLKLLPYMVFHYDFLIGFDSGKYVYDLIHQTSTSPHFINLWVEPGLNTTLTSIQTLTNINSIDMYKYLLPVFISLMLILFIFLYTKRLTSSSTSGLVSAFYFATSSVFLNATFGSYYRQLFATVILLCFLYFLDKFKDKLFSFKHIIFLGLLGASIIISHRAVSILLILLITITFFYFLLTKNIHNLKSLILIFTISLLFSSVYWSFIIAPNLIILNDTIMQSLSGKNGGGTTIKTNNKTDNQIFIYIRLMPMAFMAFIGLLSSIKNKKNLLLFFILSLSLYIFAKANFSSRFLINLEILLAIFIGI